ncbi:molybdopterin biosynthesis protein MoeB [Roseibium album]|nr:molybdopterin biosynthesis protein MoeB [Roseibium album]
MHIEGGYAGDITALEAFNALSNQQDAVLVDVRTQAEWAFVGVPDLRSIGKEPFLTEWQSFPPSGPNAAFVATLTDLLAKKGLDPEAPIYFLCRSGVRSQAAAIALSNVGYSKCFNISDGFEGPLDGESHRGTQSGWKAAGLPWIQN